MLSLAGNSRLPSLHNFTADPYPCSVPVTPFRPPVFSTPCNILFWQPLCFHIHTKNTGGVSNFRFSTRFASPITKEDQNDANHHRHPGSTRSHGPCLPNHYRRRPQHPLLLPLRQRQALQAHGHRLRASASASSTPSSSSAAAKSPIFPPPFSAKIPTASTPSSGSTTCCTTSSVSSPKIVSPRAAAPS
jgi:hypothetical protein